MCIRTDDENFGNKYASGQTCSFGWEGDKDAPITWIDGTFYLRDRENLLITFGVSDLEPHSVNWYNAEGYLPCFVSEYKKGNLFYKVENFADKLTIFGNDYEIAYSRVTATNNGKEEIALPEVSPELVRLNYEARFKETIGAGETVVREYCIGADRFGGEYPYPEDSVLAKSGSFDEHYNHMRDYWNDRLSSIINIEKIPEEYSELINAYKAGYIYTLIVADGYELHVGENGYDRVFDHDVIGMLATLIISGHTEHFSDYAQYILQNIQYPDAAWKFSWPFALYLQKTGDIETVKNFFEDNESGIAGIKTNTHKIALQRSVYREDLTDKYGNAARPMKCTCAIDSDGRWTIDNWASLFGLTTYSYICDELYKDTKDTMYLEEKNWAAAEYESLLASVEAVLHDTMDKYGFDYIPIGMDVPNEMSARSNIRDGNWAATYLFGRWNWDGYLFGANEDSWLLKKTDRTYDYIIEKKSEAFDSIYNMGGFPGYSSTYDAGYFSAALSGEKYRDGGINAYLWMINNSMSAPYSWWENIEDIVEEKNYWNRKSAVSGGGSCQHMWGQSVSSKVLIDSLLAEKYDGTIIAGRGIPKSWNKDGEFVKVSNYLCNSGARIGFTMVTEGDTVTFTLTGDELEKSVSLELIAFVDNIDSCELAYDNIAGKVTIPAHTRQVTVKLKSRI